MKKVKMFGPLLVGMLLLFTACSSNFNNDATESWDSNEASNEFAKNDSNFVSEADHADYDDDENHTGSEQHENMEANRMIIHQAYLHVKVKDLENAQAKVQDKVNKYGGYIVESTVHRDGVEHASGFITVRIPSDDFQNFLTDSEDIAAEVLERNVTGQDVTEQYVDLESRLKSKRTVEERLLDFMKEAEKTEDLLKISNDLAEVQEDIEVIVGKMNYLENQTSFSTIEISMYEDRVVVPGVDSKDLNTWEKTKKQLATSVNFILAAGSGLIVFFIGNLPVIVIVIGVGLAVYLVVRRSGSREKDE